MDLEFNFAASELVAGRPRPNLALHRAEPYTPEWREYSRHWPWTVPCELHEHCRIHGFPHRFTELNNASNTSYYTVGIGWFDYTVDYFALVPREVVARKIPILFYYHEGDNPYNIKRRLDSLNKQYGAVYCFTSGNTAAAALQNFVYFPDHELLYWQRNNTVAAELAHSNRRPYKFTLLSRTHKWWRASIVADLYSRGLLDASQWSYNTELALQDDPRDNPIEIDVLGLRTTIDRFVTNGPYTCDTLTADQHNDHHLHVGEHYTASYCNIIVETHFDADGSGGAFLTEKTFKPIKHGQLFVVVGCAGSLQALRDLGYRTFDHAIDTTYDTIANNTERWLAVRRCIEQLARTDLHALYEQCRSDIEHNQQLFLASKLPRLNTLYDKLLHQLATT